MLKTRLKVCVLLCFLATQSIYAEDAKPENSGGYGAAKTEGFFYYDDPKSVPERKPEPPKPQAAAPAPQQAQAVQPQAAPSEPKKPAPFTSAWLRERLPVLLEHAIDNPTYENVRAYRYAQRMALDLSSNFAKMSEEVNRRDPMLDESVRFPMAAAARSNALFQVERAKREIIQQISTKAGLWMFFDSKCAFCHAQYQTMKNLQRAYPNMVIRYVTTDGGIINGMQGNFYNDAGGNKARSLGIQLTPAVVMVVPEKQTLAIVAHGAMSLDELEQKIVTASIDLGIADNRLTDIANLHQRGILTPEDVNRLREQNEDGDDPEKMVEMINRAIGGRMQ